ncbi:MAG: dTDP-4-dehydrorhamnose reductase [Clostridiales bacterium]|nr:dTDP-4-dehydrorhamnose reductase [Clostridiales bacterium]
MKILITGNKGQLGNELAGILGDMRNGLGEIPEVYRDAEVVGIDIDTVDISDSAAFSAFAAGQKGAPFDLIINCAAMTNVDGCEADYEAAYKSNAVAPGNIARFAEGQGARLVHISTDYVFDGKADVPYTENDKTGPVSAYGKTKLIGEKNVQEECRRTFIVRTSWLYGKTGNNFVRTIRKIASENERITVVCDQVGNPTNADDLAHHILKIAAGGAEDSVPYGIYHVTGDGICSWYEFAEEIVRLSGLKCEVAPVTSEEYRRPAPRPAYSAMDNARLRETVGDEMRHWKEALAAYIDSIGRL